MCFSNQLTFNYLFTLLATDLKEKIDAWKSQQKNKKSAPMDTSE